MTAGWWAQIWGDWHFANSLARALRRLGQDVAVDTKQARERETRRFDDVLLTLRGLDEVPPAPGRVNLIWVISHPDEVTKLTGAWPTRCRVVSGRHTLLWTGPDHDEVS